MERTADAVTESDDQVLQNFLTHSSWDHQAVMDRVARKADTLLRADRRVGLYIDESAFQKKAISRSAWRVSGMGAWVNRTTAKLGCLVRWGAEIASVSLMRGCTCRKSRRITRGAATTQQYREPTKCIEPSSSWLWRSFATHAKVTFVSSGLACTGNRRNSCRHRRKRSSSRSIRIGANRANYGIPT